jgi:hypothetical protein
MARVCYMKQDYREAGDYLDRYFEIAQTPSPEAQRLAGKLKK